MGRLERKLLALLVLVAGLPLLVAYWLSGDLFDRSIGVGLSPPVARALDDAVGVYKEFITAEKGRQRALAQSIARDSDLRRALDERDEHALRKILERAVNRPRVFEVSIALEPPKQPGQMPPIVRAIHRDRRSDDGWLTERAVVPLEPPSRYPALRYDFGLEVAFTERFARMEADVIAPLAALEADRDNLTEIYTWSFVGALASAVLAASVLAVLIGRRTTRRLSRLRGALAAVAEGDLDVRLVPEGSDEMADLAGGFNQMADRLVESYQRVEYLTRVSAWQGIARRLAHEIKNPLTPILLAIQQAHSRYHSGDPKFREVIDTAREVIEEEVVTLQRLVENFSRFARLPTVQMRNEELTAMIDELIAAHPEHGNVAREGPHAPIVAMVDRGLLRQALTNLFNNAAEAARGVGRAPRIRVVVNRNDDGEARVVIRDNGPGVPEADREHIFDPYVSGRADGTGLGLAIVKKIILDHGGRVRVVDGHGGGATFELILGASGLDHNSV